MNTRAAMSKRIVSLSALAAIALVIGLMATTGTEEKRPPGLDSSAFFSVGTIIPLADPWDAF